jgi:hypothetical protein
LLQEDYLDKQGFSRLNGGVCYQRWSGSSDLSKMTIAHDKGKPVVRQGRKAKSLEHQPICRVFKKVWLPKAIEEQPSDFGW